MSISPGKTINFFQGLPLELMQQHVLPHLSLKELCKLRLTSRAVNESIAGCVDHYVKALHNHVGIQQVEGSENASIDTIKKLYERYRIDAATPLIQLELNNFAYLKQCQHDIATLRLQEKLEYRPGCADLRACKSAAEVRTWMGQNPAALSAVTVLNFDTTHAHPFLPLKSKIEIIPLEIKLLKNLEYLGFKGNQIYTIPEGCFQGLTHLKILNLSNNKIHTLPEHCFEGLKNLQYLHLDNNKIHTIPGNCFQWLTNLGFLNLSHNNIHEIPGNCFQDLTQLKKLSLFNNNIHTIPDHCFQWLTNLDFLHLSNNNIHEIPGNCFKELKNLETLYLDNNQIQTIPENCFKELKNLKNLYLDNNQIQTNS